ncbi:MAG: glycosyltransferase, partial [Thermoleophilaceae bacterium]|nr:glycosyltransferase [Thermoleophilaceae bacterium]
MIKVAVCTNRDPSAAAPSLDALRAQVPEDRLLLVASATAPEGFGEVVIHEPRPGLSRARNRAVEWCSSDEDVLAFVDDDALVDPRWYAELSARWQEAPDSVACIGGPIRPEWSAPPPGWISEPLLPALTLLDMGESVLDIDPEIRTVYGANISFRAGPLRRTGGFDPAYGHSGERAGFGEEDEAERALARLGFGIRYVPDAGVRHVIPPDRLTRG